MKLWWVVLVAGCEGGSYVVSAKDEEHAINLAKLKAPFNDAHLEDVKEVKASHFAEVLQSLEYSC